MILLSRSHNQVKLEVHSLPPISKSTVPKPQINEPKPIDLEKRKNLGASYLEYARSHKKAKIGSLSERQSLFQSQDKLPLINNKSVSKSNSKSHFRLKSQPRLSPQPIQTNRKPLAAIIDPYKQEINQLNKMVEIIEKTKKFDMTKLPVSKTEQRIPDGKIRREVKDCKAGGQQIDRSEPS